MLEIACFKCGKLGSFKSIAEAWSKGWSPITRDQYVCEPCSQLEYTDKLDYSDAEYTDIKKYIPKKKSEISDK